MALRVEGSEAQFESFAELQDGLTAWKEKMDSMSEEVAKDNPLLQTKAGGR